MIHSHQESPDETLIDEETIRKHDYHENIMDRDTLTNAHGMKKIGYIVGFTIGPLFILCFVIIMVCICVKRRGMNLRNVMKMQVRNNEIFI